MIRLPEGYAIHKRDKTCLMGGNWSVRVMHYDSNMTAREAFIMKKITVFMADNFGTRITYKAALRDGNWVEFDNEQDMCIAMCAKHRMLVR